MCLRMRFTTKRQIDRFSHFGTVHGRKSLHFYNGRPFPKKIALTHWGSGPHLTHDSLGSSEPMTQTAFRSVQPFLHRWPQSVPILYNGTPLPPKIATSHGGSGPLSNTRFPGPTQVLNPNGISISSAVFACSLVCTWQIRRQAHRPRYSVGNNRPHRKRLSFKIYENLYWIQFSLLSFELRRPNLTKSLQWNFYWICCSLRGFKFTTTQFLRSLVNFLHASERTPQNSHNSMVITNYTPFTKPR